MNYISLTAAVRDVFNTAEVHEQILLNLPIRDLLLAQRISKDWKSTITNSPSIQAALGLSSKCEPLDRVELLAGSKERRMVHRVTNVFHQDVHVLNLHRVSGHEMSQWARSPDPIVNRLLHYLFGDPSNEVLAINPLKLRSQHVDCSWRKMTLTVPPTKSVYVHKIPNKLHKKGLHTWNAHYGPPVRGVPLSICSKQRGGVHELFNPTGVTVLQLIEHVEKLLSEGKSGNLYVKTLGYIG